MPMRGAPYPPEFREEALRVFRSSEKSFPQVAKELGIADESLRRGLRQAGRNSPAIGANEKGSLRRSARSSAGCAAKLGF